MTHHPGSLNIESLVPSPEASNLPARKKSSRIYRNGRSILPAHR
jgi:hypothetical protein